ncbi:MULTISPECIES: UDP-N-acetylmuramoyl-L-alanine--D-glutamate ligase [Methylobacterium]|uniref:UDP-N-acetylmuramoylalanine--D-glutamate ligase n=1 Tax=Methylobacterium jeotgali TaxID=381630 RepID=A0ABQ4SYU3_9HYPH|nr:MULTISPECIES: UDP-N-acetylmuramoyl-L-alanine--D-glutamate ligase [Methylobacterium]PIU04228.1 MAG: UDP-N-acetylmuramoyl-L-alanine--D-glutamate ligase [Methylobacterium sp. CG09_land_8_20_14_0_10_71_15]PIU12783.1 MAG: UDP-N-acetylmuramoyl-L-alanine--D-glutamate ligase [Methylobacterium sp. CG08_land_8_20_14_0_20_71_15]GBU19216.1 UDP-N-acetylmuramoyl-L-alanine:D-glutamate ligase [Methylobacterium sp.]GJE08385.1 UDP-N-acetylmuramoylalanine--D-glutamate ligase [Methylobacterium jeotgali]
MTPVTTFAGRRVALFGLGGSGLATALALKAGGAEVLAWDDSPESVARAAAKDVTTGDLRGADWSGIAALVLSPGVPLTHPAPHWSVGLAKEAVVEIIGDVELFCRERTHLSPQAPFIAITGTNGKSTTTALIAHILVQAGRDVQMGGNIGTAILSLEPPSEDRVHVIELSSFQIDLTPSLNPSVGLLLNITPDHLDRHGAMESYAAIKERLVAGASLAVVGVDDAPSRAIAERRTGPLVRVRVTASAAGVPFDGLTARDAAVFDAGGAQVADLSGIGSLRGPHNWQNAAFALAAARAVGLSDEAIQAGLRSFPGLPHRMEEVGKRGPVLFVNDSKATNADSTEKALGAFRDIHWILGGKAKDGGIFPLVPLFDRVAHAYLIGAASDAFAATLEGMVPYTRCEILEAAVPAAAENAAASGAPEPVVLLSPACASYDQFPNFEVRGDRFRDLVRGLG